MEARRQTEEELAEAEAARKLELKRKKRLPKGMSAYQAAWILEFLALHGPMLAAWGVDELIIDLLRQAQGLIDIGGASRVEHGAVHPALLIRNL